MMTLMIEMWKHSSCLGLYLAIYCLMLEGCSPRCSGKLTELREKDVKRGRRNVGTPTADGGESYWNSTVSHWSTLHVNTNRNLTGLFNSSQWIAVRREQRISTDFSDSYGSLFKFDSPTSREIHAREISKIHCPVAQVYDFFIQVCRRGIGASDLTALSKRVFIVVIFMRPNISSLYLPLINKARMNQAIVDKLDVNDTSIYGIKIGTVGAYPTVTAAFILDLRQTILEGSSVHSVRAALSSLSILFNGTIFTVSMVMMKYSTCPVGEIFRPDEYTVQGDILTITASGETFQDMEFYTKELTESKNGSYVPTGVLTVCKQPIINCSGVFIGLTKDEYFISSNSSLYRKVSGEVIEPEQFHFIYGNLWVCVNFSSCYSREKLTHDLMTEEIVSEVLTYVGLSVSSVSFLIVFVTYSLFKELRTLPGVDLMNFSIAHIAKDLLFVTTAGRLPKLACTTVAMTMHYFFLVSFNWMSIIAFETWRAFSKIRIQPRNLSRRQKCGYVLRRIALGWVPPLVFVLVCITLNQSHTATFRYGETRTSRGCWINIPTANLFSCILPIAITIAFNTVFFFLTVIAIRKTNQQVRTATHHAANRKTAAVFTKIFILMGFPWIFGFLQSQASKYFRYPFVILTTFTGLYVAIAFVSTSRVRRLYHRLLCFDKTSIASRTPPTAEINNEDRV